MVLVWACFCILMSAVAFAAYAWFPILDRMPAGALAFFIAYDFIITPLGVLSGGALGLVWGKLLQGSITVMFRFGTWPTGMRVTSLSPTTSTTDTELDPALAT